MQPERELFDDFVFYHNHTAHWQKLKQAKPFMRDLKPTPQRLKLFSDLSKWCQGRGINPKHWLYSLFAVRRWMYSPRLEKSYLLSEKHIPKFQKFSDYQFYRQRQQQEAVNHKIPENVFDPNRDLSNMTEILKRDLILAGQMYDCMNRSMQDTYGFHPKSKVCGGCSVRDACRDMLVRASKFDIMALREGRITSEQARAQAVAQVQSYAR